MDIFKNADPLAKTASGCFFLSAITFTISFLSGSSLGYTSELWALTYWGPALYFCLFNFVLRYCYKDVPYDVAVRATFLGTAFATGIHLTTFEDGIKIFGRYTMILSFFHFSEFLAVALTNPKTLKVDSFVLNHSVSYGVAAVSSWIEFAVEYYYFPEMKTYYWLSLIGVVMCIGGELMRKGAMFTASTNFNHMVQTVKHPDHHLVTHGVYSLCRHPGYVGWFYWSIGTQIALLNPICIIIYTIASWKFFVDRVYHEEMTLLAFFGTNYIKYQEKVGTGLPFIQGFVPENTKQRVKDDHWSY